MKNVIALTKRNCLQFFRSKQVIFSSLISSMVIVGLYFLFVANLYAQGLNDSNTGLTAAQINALIYTQMIMGVLIINSISLAMSVFSFMARDFETRKTEAFLLTRTKPVEITLAYLLAAMIVTVLINGLTLVVSLLIIGMTTGVWLGCLAALTIFAVLLLTTIIGCAIMLLITSLVRSSIAVGVINGIMGTVLGFLCGIYMPYSNMAAGAVYVGSLLPFTHLTILLKKIALGDLFTQFGVPDAAADIIAKDAFSAANVGLCGLDVPLWGMIIFSAVFGLICFVISIFLIKKLFSNKTNNKLKK